VPKKTETVTLIDLDNAPSSLPGVNSIASAKEIDELRRRFTTVSDEKAELQLKYDKLIRENRAADILDGLIEPYARLTFRFMCSYCGFVALIITMNAFNCFKRPITDGVLQILVGSTAATVIGLVGMVLTGIFIGARKKRS
jgi:hypothetical protein